MKSSRLVESFAGQWLECALEKRHARTGPLAPLFDEALRSAMLKESECSFEAWSRSRSTGISSTRISRF